MFGGHLGDQVHRTANPVTFHVGLQCFADLDGLHHVRRNRIELHLADSGLGRWHVYAVDHRIRQARLEAADLNVLPFAFVALKSDAGQPPQGVRHVGVRQAADNFGRNHLHEIVRVSLDVDRLGFAGDARGGHQDRFILRLQFELASIFASWPAATFTGC